MASDTSDNMELNPNELDKILEGEVVENGLGNALDAMNDPPGVNESDISSSLIPTFTDMVRTVINEAQFRILQGRTPRQYIKRRMGKGGQTFSYVPHGYVTAVLNKAFGFDWDWELLPIDGSNMFRVMEKGATGESQKASVLVYGKLTVRVRSPESGNVLATIHKCEFGEKEFITNMSWGALVKSASSDAFKKCASRMGVALDLYWQDADEDYMPKPQPPESLMPLIRAVRAVSGWKTMPPPALAERASITVPQVAEALKYLNSDDYEIPN